MSSAKQLVESGLNLNKPGPDQQIRSSHLADPLSPMKDVCVRVIIVLHFLIPFYFNIAFNFHYKFQFCFNFFIIWFILVVFIL